jgi:hypothetical protein
VSPIQAAWDQVTAPEESAPMTFPWHLVAPAFLLATPGAGTLEVGPAEVALESPLDRQRIVVFETSPDGLTVDRTAQARVTVDDPRVAHWDAKSFCLVPAADGQTQARVSAAGTERLVKVTARGTTPAASGPVSFRLDVEPILMKAGCNSGRCHGSARGQDGFRLSLFGYDPAGDHERLTREIRGRRVNLAYPDESLMLRKAAGAVVHTGGKLLDPSDHRYQTLRRWIEEGAADDSAGVAAPVSVAIFPPRLTLKGPKQTQRLLVQARYSDGSDRDVTDLAVYLSDNDASAKVDTSGLVTSNGRGEAFVMARFATFTVGIPAIVLPDGPDQAPAKLQVRNYIDELVGAKLARMRISPSEPCTDQEFLRRASIDLNGRLPTRSDVEAFLADTDPKKREAMVDRLLARDEFIELWAMKWAELLKVRTANQVSYKGLLKYHSWLLDRLRKGRPFDQIVRDLIRATGGTFENPAAQFYQLETNTLVLTEDVAQMFMGVRVQCAQCHNHPFDRWTMNDYYGFAAFFAQVGFKQSSDPREYVVYDRAEGEIRHPVDGRVVLPRYLGGGEVARKDRNRHRRAALADWIASPGNPLFARHLANLIWSQYFGRGIIEPVDDVRVSNPPSNPELLDALAARLTASRYDFKALTREIVNSQTYQLSTRSNPGNAEDVRNFSRAQVRRIRAEVLLDNISRVTETDDRFDRMPAGTRATQIVDGLTTNDFLTTFGRATRNTVCACEVNVQPNLSQALHLLNGETTTGKIEQGNVVGKLLKQGKSSAEVADDLYLRCYGRRPTAAERAELEPRLKADPDAKRALEDLFWALLNSKEFLFNH